MRVLDIYERQHARAYRDRVFRDLYDRIVHDALYVIRNERHVFIQLWTQLLLDLMRQ